MGNRLSIYVNGALEGTTTIPGSNLTINTISLPLYVGRGEATALSNAVFDDLQVAVQLAGTSDSPVQTEVPIYGAGKLATYYPAHSVAADQSNTDAGSTAYEITDHLGNVRALVRIHANEYTATMEDDGTATYTNPRVRENVYFKNLFETEKRDVQMNHTSKAITAAPSRAANLHWISGHPDPNFAPDKKSVGPAIALSVSPGDQIDLSAWARFKIKNVYNNATSLKAIIASALTSQYVFSNGLESITQAASALNAGVLAAVPANPDDPNAPKAYINYVVFNSSYLVVNGGALQVPASAGFEEAQRNSPYTNANLVKFESPVTIAQPGYIYIWVSNESENTEVWFDDVSVIHHKPLVAQATDYEAWGGVLREQKWIDLDAKYRYGYQGKYAEKDDETGWDHFELREYDAVIGRWNSTDPKKQYFSRYLAMGNNPISKVDPDGAYSFFGALWRTVAYGGQFTSTKVDGKRTYGYVDESGYKQFGKRFDGNIHDYNFKAPPPDQNLMNAQPYVSLSIGKESSEGSIISYNGSITLAPSGLYVTPGGDVTFAAGGSSIFGVSASISAGFIVGPPEGLSGYGYFSSMGAYHAGIQVSQSLNSNKYYLPNGFGNTYTIGAVMSTSSAWVSVGSGYSLPYNSSNIPRLIFK